MNRWFVSVTLTLSLGTSHAIAQPRIGIEAICDVTAPNGVVAGQTAHQTDSFGNPLLSVGPFGLWPDGTVVFKPGGAGFVTTDGALGMKFGWTRGIPGKLRVTGRRIDGEAAALRTEIPCCYGATGFQASALIFSTPGCWQVTAQINDREDSKLVFVTKVIKVGDGPRSRRDPRDHAQVTVWPPWREQLETMRRVGPRLRALHGKGLNAREVPRQSAGPLASENVIGARATAETRRQPK